MRSAPNVFSRRRAIAGDSAAPPFRSFDRAGLPTPNLLAASVTDMPDGMTRCRMRFPISIEAVSRVTQQKSTPWASQPTTLIGTKPTSYVNCFLINGYRKNDGRGQKQMAPSPEFGLEDLAQGRLAGMIGPDKPTSSRQKYRTTGRRTAPRGPGRCPGTRTGEPRATSNDRSVSPTPIFTQQDNGVRLRCPGCHSCDLTRALAESSDEDASAHLLIEDVADLVLQRTVICLGASLEALDDPIVQVADSQIAHGTLRRLVVTIAQ